MSKYTYTAIDEYYQLCRRFGINPDYVNNSTLNDTLGIESGDPGVPLGTGTTTYLALGNGGHSGFTTGSALGITLKDRIGRFTGLYNIVPWVLREIDDDLTPEELVKYRMRRIENHDGVSLVAYYLKKVDVSDITRRMIVETTSAGETTNVDWIPTQAESYHQELDTGYDTDSTRLIVDAEMNIALTNQEVEDVINSVQLVSEENSTSIISEYGLYNGIEVVRTANINGVMTSYNEVVNAYLSLAVTPSRLLDFQAGALQDRLYIGKAFPYK